MPVAEYEHPTGKCVIGGYVYRGSAYPALRGIYVYGDWVSGRMWGLRSDGETETTEFDRTSLNISSFGEDAEGEALRLRPSRRDGLRHGGVGALGIAPTRSPASHRTADPPRTRGTGRSERNRTSRPREPARPRRPLPRRPTAAAAARSRKRHPLACLAPREPIRSAAVLKLEGQSPDERQPGDDLHPHGPTGGCLHGVVDEHPQRDERRCRPHTVNDAPYRREVGTHPS